MRHRGAGVFVTGANIQDKKQVWIVLISDQDWSFFFFFSVLYIENIFLYLKILQMNWFGNSGRRVKTKGNNNENMMPASQNTYVGCMWVPGSHADLIPDGRRGAGWQRGGGRPGSWHSSPLSLSSRLVPYEDGCSQIFTFPAPCSYEQSIYPANLQETFLHSRSYCFFWATEFFLFNRLCESFFFRLAARKFRTK